MDEETENSGLEKAHSVAGGVLQTTAALISCAAQVFWVFAKTIGLILGFIFSLAFRIVGFVNRHV